MDKTNRELFLQALTDAYVDLFETPDYRIVAAKTSPKVLANRMMEGIEAGSASIEGEAIKRVCTQLKIKRTFKDITAYLKR